MAKNNVMLAFNLTAKAIDEDSGFELIPYLAEGKFLDITVIDSKIGDIDFEGVEGLLNEVASLIVNIMNNYVTDHGGSVVKLPSWL